MRKDWMSGSELAAIVRSNVRFLNEYFGEESIRLDGFTYKNIAVLAARAEIDPKDLFDPELPKFFQNPQYIKKKYHRMMTITELDEKLDDVLADLQLFKQKYAQGNQHENH